MKTVVWRQDSGLLAMKFFFPRAVTPTAPFSTDSISRQTSRSCTFSLHTGYHGKQRRGN